MANETNTTNFLLDTSGYSLSVPNLVMQSSGNLSVSYVINGLPTSVSIAVEGIVSPQTANSDFGAQPGTPVLLDTYNSTSSVSNRSIALNGMLYDSFRFTATFAGGTNPTIAGSITTSGSGQAYNSAYAPLVQTVAS